MAFEQAKTRITKSKAVIGMRFPFYAVIGLSLNFVCAQDAFGDDADRLIPTMATDGRSVWWNVKFVERLVDVECTFVIAHEILHVAWLHPLRRGSRHPLIWNLACDYAINQTLVDAGFVMPSGKKCGLIDPKYKGWPAEKIYRDLLENKTTVEKKFTMAGPGEDGGDDDVDGEGRKRIWGTVQSPEGEQGEPLSKADMDQLIEETKIKVMSAAQAQKSRGNVPAGFEQLIKAVNQPVINWQDYIQSWASGHTPDDYTWRRPNRSMMALFEIYQPSIHCHGAGVGVLSIDNSGSVSDDELVTYVSQIVGMIELCKPSKLYIIQHDAAVQRVDLWEEGDDFNDLKIKGRGGTCITPVFQYCAKEIDDTIDWMICFTDMGIGDYPPEDLRPDYPVLWCATGPDNAPFGTYLSVKDAMEV